jgi:hypothetical protein
MGLTASTEPQCLYSRAIPLLPLWAVRPVQSLSACTRVHFTFTLPFTAKKTVALCPLVGIRGVHLSEYVYSTTEVITMQVMKAQGGAEIQSIHSQLRHYVADKWSAS